MYEGYINTSIWLEVWLLFKYDKLDNGWFTLVIERGCKVETFDNNWFANVCDHVHYSKSRWWLPLVLETGWTHYTPDDEWFMKVLHCTRLCTGQCTIEILNRQWDCHFKC